MDRLTFISFMIMLLCTATVIGSVAYIAMP